MLPDFTKPAFGFLAICTVRFRERDDGSTRGIRSDYRCQVRHTDAADDVEARVYLVGQDHAASGEDVPVILAFLGVKPNQANAEALIRSTLENPARTFYGDKVIDVYNAAGQGVRFDRATNAFRGFLEGGLATQ